MRIATVSPHWQHSLTGLECLFVLLTSPTCKNQTQVHSSQRGLLLARREHRSIIFHKYQTDQIKCSILLVCNMEQQVSEFVLKQRRPPPPAPILISRAAAGLRRMGNASNYFSNFVAWLLPQWYTNLLPVQKQIYIYKNKDLGTLRHQESKYKPVLVVLECEIYIFSKLVCFFSSTFCFKHVFGCFWALLVFCPCCRKNIRYTFTVVVILGD